MNPTTQCQHLNFTARVTVNRLEVNRLEDSRKFMAEVRLCCSECELPFHFVGLPCGISFHAPKVNADGTELRAPIQPGRGPLARLAKFEMP